jgi:hypothetical protein
MRKVQVITRNQNGRPQRFCRRPRRGRPEMLFREANRKVKKILFQPFLSIVLPGETLVSQLLDMCKT